MKRKRINSKDALAAFLLCLIAPSFLSAHCDTMDGPVVTAAKQALEKGDVTPVLKWVKPEYEQEVRLAFQRTLNVRGKGAEAQELADLYFFETVVRLHRAGEGEPYTGLKPAGTQLEPAVLAADKALESGSVDELIKMVSDEIASGIRQRFDHALAAQKHSEHNVQAGREFVSAYVEFVHFVEQLYHNATAGTAERKHHEEN